MLHDSVNNFLQKSFLQKMFFTKTLTRGIVRRLGNELQEKSAIPTKAELFSSLLTSGTI